MLTLVLFTALISLLIFILQLKSHTRTDIQLQQLKDMHHQLFEKINDVTLKQHQAFSDHRNRFDERQMECLKILQDSLQTGTAETRAQMKEHLENNTKNLSERMENLTKTTEKRLREISVDVEKRLSDGFEKTNETFSNIIKRLALIDAAQIKITELSSHVINLKDILNDKRTRGAFGEIQLIGLIRNMLSENNFSLQHTLSNSKRVDCLLLLPEPTGNIAIDAKFPLEGYQRLMGVTTLAEHDRKLFEQQFRQDIKKHIQDISEKYIISGETADGAVMFIPAEAVFAEIHSHYPDLVEMAQRAKVWMVSPTTMMAILTTARAVLKDSATRQQVNIIQQHLHYLSKEFERFQKRMDNVAKHIAQAHTDVEEVHISAKKISQQFNKIEKVELSGADGELLS